MALQVSLREHLLSLGTSDSDKPQPGGAIDRVKTAIQNARCLNNEGSIFIPNNTLENLLTRTTICDVISSMANLSAHELDPELTALVDEIDPRDKRNLNDSRRRILAILIMGDIPNLIIHFIDAGIGDRHLPFEYQHDGQLEYTKDDGSRAVCPFRCFDNDPSKLYNFEISQWDYMAPVFSFTEEEVHHHQIQYRIPLPFTEDNIVPTQGGNSQVRQVVIHHEHHDLVSSSS